eukprot:350934-Chlamydomonas_euryale.AAC.2
MAAPVHSEGTYPPTHAQSQSAVLPRDCAPPNTHTHTRLDQLVWHHQARHAAERVHLDLRERRPQGERVGIAKGRWGLSKKCGDNKQGAGKDVLRRWDGVGGFRIGMCRTEQWAGGTGGGSR